jgi:hypothetical protein
MSWEPSPTVRRMVWVLDGSKNSPFNIELNDRVKMSAAVNLVQYTVINTPVTGTTPNTPLLIFQPGPMLTGLQFSGCTSNVVPMDAFHVVLSEATTDKVISVGKKVGVMQGGEMRTMSLHVSDLSHNAHNATSNKLFDYCILEFEIAETPIARNPLWLQKVPTIQQTLDTE